MHPYFYLGISILVCIVVGYLRQPVVPGAHALAEAGLHGQESRHSSAAGIEPIDTQFLKTFVTVVDQGSMAAAARLLNITSAAVAQQIHTLERELGAPLIVRVGRTVRMTEEGARILLRARELVRDFADLRSIANDSDVSGELRLGACTTALAGMLPDILARMVGKFPQINVYIQPGLFGAALRRGGKRRAGCGVRAAGALRIAEDLRLAAAARGAADRAGAAPHGGSGSARSARERAADPLRPQPVGRAAGR